MYRTFDEEIFLAPESIIAGVLATAAFADAPELPDVEPASPVWQGAADRPGADTDDAAPGTDEPAFARTDADSIEAWSRHSRGASGFGG